MAYQVFAGLMLDAQATSKVLDGIVDAVAMSYALVGGTRTDLEDKRRTNMCIEIFRVCRGDMHWSVQRCVDEMPRALQTQLAGGFWEPDKRRSWAGR